ncbi:MAG TPA: undecaprenyl-diphosphate phosphatase [Candidatus Pelethocola excrementipullorum]|nr:undecaprenyl-diphosphate phosphatase [Candidatus Pelethocola excrementipullorum]
MNLIEWLKVILLGIVEGITEWLPISSTGHLILVNEFVKLKQSDAFMEMFNVVIQLGAILAVVVLYFPKLWPFHTKKNAPAKPIFASPSDNKGLAWCQNFMTNYFHMDKIVLWLKIVVACLPAMVIGLPLDDWMEEHLHNYFVVALMLIIYGVLFIVIENYNKTRKPTIRRLKDITFQDALLIGIFQVLSLIPGTSRSGATIIGGILIGTTREIAAEFTFFLAIPVMFGASFIKLLKFGLSFTAIEASVLILGMVVAFVVSILAIKFLMGYIKKHDFKVFGWYRIALGILVLLYFGIKSFIAA